MNIDRLGLMYRPTCVKTLYVDKVRNKLQMIRPHTTLDTAQMIPFHSKGRPSRKEMMCATHATIEAKHSVSVAIKETSKEPTSVRLDNFGPKAIFRWRTPSNSRWSKCYRRITVAQFARMVHAAQSVFVRGLCRAGAFTTDSHINVHIVARSGVGNG